MLIPDDAFNMELKVKVGQLTLGDESAFYQLVGGVMDYQG